VLSCCYDCKIKIFFRVVFAAKIAFHRVPPPNHPTNPYFQLTNAKMKQKESEARCGGRTRNLEMQMDQSSCEKVKHKSLTLYRLS
jgi:hypothetical protein